MIDQTIKLAIVIPYYKPNFFREALLSVKEQTDNRFHLYIGNDASPDDPAEIIKEIFNDSDTVTYHKFENNLGQLHLTKQWGRCIDLATEPYIWLFSDDDVMPVDAVARFYQFIEQYPDAELIRFNINIINDDNRIINAAPIHPQYETAQAFLHRRLLGQCISAACEYIFTKKVYTAKLGFVDFPLAWASDDATWTKFGAQKGIYTIKGAPVLWRFGSISISSSTKNTAPKTKACLMFVRFVRENTTASRHLQLCWLFLQLNVLNYSTLMKTRFVIHLIKTGMFNFTDLLRFLISKSIKKVSGR